MPSRNRAAYMRDYRAKHRGAPGPSVEGPDLCQGHAERIAFLEGEVVRLKRELASRQIGGNSFNSRPFTPVPKPSQRGK